MINKKILKNLILASTCLPILGATVAIIATSCSGSETPKQKATITGEASFEAKQGIQTQKQYISDIPSNEEVKWSLSGSIPNGVEIDNETGLLTVDGCPLGEYTILINAESSNYLATLPVQISVDILNDSLLNYNITSEENKTVEVIGLSDDNPNPSTIIIPEKINFEGKEYTVTSIRENAFKGCSTLISLNIGNEVTKIGEYAFWDCNNLTSLIIGNGVEIINQNIFSSEKLTTISIGSSVHTINNNAFARCTNITSISIDDANLWYGEAINVGTNATVVVRRDGGVPELKYYNNNSNIVTGLACGDVALPDTFTEIGVYAFVGCGSLTSITIPNCVETICLGAFNGCSGLTSLTIPNSVTNIEQLAFAGCSSLTSIAIPDGVVTIDDYTFEGCSGLTSVAIPDSVESIGYQAFYGCSSLTSITIPNNVTNIEECIFEGCSSLSNIYCDESTKNLLETNRALYGIPETCVITVV